MKLGQIIGSCMTNISNIFLAQWWRPETSSWPFYDFIKLTIYWNLDIFNVWHLPFLIVPYVFFQKNKTLESWHNWLLSNWSKLLNWNGTRNSPQSSKNYLKFFSFAYICQLDKLGDLINWRSKDILKNAPCHI